MSSTRSSDEVRALRISKTENGVLRSRPPNTIRIENGVYSSRVHVEKFRYQSKLHAALGEHTNRHFHDERSNPKKGDV